MRKMTQRIETYTPSRSQKKSRQGFHLTGLKVVSHRMKNDSSLFQNLPGSPWVTTAFPHTSCRIEESTLRLLTGVGYELESTPLSRTCQTYHDIEILTPSEETILTKQSSHTLRNRVFCAHLTTFSFPLNSNIPKGLKPRNAKT
jgi:hypothetical protein